MKHPSLLPLVASFLAFIGCEDATEPEEIVISSSPVQSVGSSEGYEITDIGTLGGDVSSAYAINARGQVVGESMTGTAEFHAFVWENGVMTDLGSQGGDHSVARGINARGQVIGESGTFTGAPARALLWTPKN